mmetsp:Transcript_12408/g.18555  ORF Transcript_12408/g.18555 Transcript_12408/m.18555 type:complete len:400 (-) Transcript_12408:7-1206(-)
MVRRRKAPNPKALERFLRKNPSTIQYMEENQYLDEDSDFGYTDLVEVDDRSDILFLDEGVDISPTVEKAKLRRNMFLEKRSSTRGSSRRTNRHLNRHTSEPQFMTMRRSRQTLAKTLNLASLQPSKDINKHIPASDLDHKKYDLKRNLVTEKTYRTKEPLLHTEVVSTPEQQYAIGNLSSANLNDIWHAKIGVSQFDARPNTVSGIRVLKQEKFRIGKTKPERIKVVNNPVIIPKDQYLIHPTLRRQALKEEVQARQAELAIRREEAKKTKLNRILKNAYRRGVLGVDDPAFERQQHEIRRTQKLGNRRKELIASKGESFSSKETHDWATPTQCPERMFRSKRKVKQNLESIKFAKPIRDPNPARMKALHAKGSGSRSFNIISGAPVVNVDKIPIVKRS